MIQHPNRLALQKLRSLVFCMLLVVTMVFCGDSLRGQSPLYDFSVVATTDDPTFQSIASQIPEIASDGRILFSADAEDEANPGFFTDIVFRATELGLQQIAQSSVPTASGGRLSSVIGPVIGAQQINGSGSVVFVGGSGGSTESSFVFTQENGLVELYSRNGSIDTAFRFSRLQQPAVNDAGDVAFIGSNQQHSTAVFVGDTNASRPVSVAASPVFDSFLGFNRLSNVQLAADGTVFLEATSTESDQEAVFRVERDGTATRVVETGGLFTSVDLADVSPEGLVLFTGSDASGTRALALQDGDRFQVIAVDNSQYEIVNDPGVNDRGEVVFRAILNNPGVFEDVLLTGSDLIDDRLVGVGDTLFGESVLQVFAGAGSISNRGDIAFFAATRNESTGNVTNGIYVATLVVPEPSSFLLLGLGSTLLSSRRRRSVAN